MLSFANTPARPHPDITSPSTEPVVEDNQETTAPTNPTATNFLNTNFASSPSGNGPVTGPGGTAVKTTPVAGKGILHTLFGATGGQQSTSGVTVNQPASSQASVTKGSTQQLGSSLQTGGGTGSPAAVAIYGSSSSSSPASPSTPSQTSQTLLQQAEATGQTIVNGQLVGGAGTVGGDYWNNPAVQALQNTGYVQNVSEQSPAPGGGTQTTNLNSLYYGTQATANLLANQFGGSVVTTNPSQNTNQVNQAQQYSVDINGNVYNAGLLLNEFLHGDVSAASLSEQGGG